MQIAVVIFNFQIISFYIPYSYIYNIYRICRYLIFNNILEINISPEQQLYRFEFPILCVLTQKDRNIYKLILICIVAITCVIQNILTHTRLALAWHLPKKYHQVILLSVVRVSFYSRLILPFMVCVWKYVLQWGKIRWKRLWVWRYK